MIYRFIIRPRNGFYISGVVTGLAAVAIFAFGAPPVILVGVAWGGGLAYAKAITWAEQRLRLH